MKPLVDLAAKTNILRPEITLHLMEYDLIWERYKIFQCSGKFKPEMNVVKELIRHAFELQLNRSVEGWQGDLLFTQRHEHIIKKRREEKRKKFFGAFKSKEEED